MRWKLVFDGLLSKGKLKKQLCFGYATEVNDDDVIEKWPFLLHPPKGVESAKIDFGVGATECRIEPVNIFDKLIEPDNLFTRGKGEGESAYRITRIETLL